MDEDFRAARIDTGYLERLLASGRTEARDVAPEEIVAVAAAHHRFLWIHPFYDGNGRVARLMSHAMFTRLGIGNSLWSVARGLARNVATYKSLLNDADQPRHTDLHGRGALSERALVTFCRFFLDAAVDQIMYMRSILEPTELLHRIEIYTEEETRAGRLPARSRGVRGPPTQPQPHHPHWLLNRR